MDGIPVATKYGVPLHFSFDEKKSDGMMSILIDELEGICVGTRDLTWFKML